MDLFHTLIQEGELLGFILYVDPGKGVTWIYFITLIQEGEFRGFILYVDPGKGVTWIYCIP